MHEVNTPPPAPPVLLCLRPCTTPSCCVYRYVWPNRFEGFRGWGLINGLVLTDESPVLAGAVVNETTKLGLLLVPAGLKVILSKLSTFFRHLKTTLVIFFLHFRNFRHFLDTLDNP